MLFGSLLDTYQLIQGQGTHSWCKSASIVEPHELEGSHFDLLTTGRDRFSCRGHGTGTNYEKRVSGTRNSVRKFQPGKRGHLLDFPLSLGIFQWDELTKRVPFTAEPEIPEILTKWEAPLSLAFKTGF